MDGTGPREREDRALARAMLAGDEAAFDRFFDLYFPGLYRFALTRVGGDHDAAEEAAQATVCRAVRRLASWRGEATLFTWMCTICRREIHDRFRRRGVVGTEELVEDRPEVRAALESLGGEVPTPADALDRVELVRLVWVALDRLPPRYGLALEWKYLEDLPVREIARRLDVSLKAAESLLTRSRAAFRDAFETLVGPTGPAGEPAPEAES